MSENNLLKKQFIAKSEVDADERTVVATINTDVVDRDGEVLLPKGANLERYLKNPVVLWAHQYAATPIARTMWMKKGNKQITAKAQFATTPMAEEVYGLFKGGFLNAFSIGFKPAENGSHPPTPDEIKKHPEWAEAKRIYDNWELLEFSAVPVPANPDALAVAVKTKAVNLSKELQEQLGIEDEETFYTTTATTIKFDTVEQNGSSEIIIVDDKFIPGRKPEETEDYIHIPIRSKNDFVQESFRTIDISKKEGILAVIGKLTSDPQGSTHVQKYLFDKAKGWTMERARAWVEAHKEGKFEMISEKIIETDNFIETLPVISTEPFEDTNEIAKEAINKVKGVMYI